MHLCHIQAVEKAHFINVQGWEMLTSIPLFGLTGLDSSPWRKCVFRGLAEYEVVTHEVTKVTQFPFFGNGGRDRAKKSLKQYKMYQKAEKYRRPGKAALYIPRFSADDICSCTAKLSGFHAFHHWIAMLPMSSDAFNRSWFFDASNQETQRSSRAFGLERTGQSLSTHN